MADLFRNYINGKWVDSESGQTYDRSNPATGELVATYVKSTAKDVQVAVDAAKTAFESWRLFPAPKRGEILYRVGQIMLDKKEQFAREMTEEMGKVISEARGDVQEAIDMAFYMAGEGRRLYGQTTPSELPNKWNMSVRKPIGVAGIVTPWNFPMAIPSWKIFPAIVAGNTVVFKPASMTARSAVRFVEILDRGRRTGRRGQPGDRRWRRGRRCDYRPPGHPADLLHRFDRDRHRCVDGRGAKLNKRVSLEMGGKNAVIVMDGCGPRPGRERHPLERIRDVGTTLHGRKPCCRGPQCAGEAR